MESAKQMIVRAAREEFSRAGYRSASTNRIVAAAGVSKGLLFSYFGTKQELYLFVLVDELARFVKAVAASPLAGRDPVERFEQVIGAAFAYYNRHRTGFALMMTSTDVDRPLQGELMARLAAARLPDPFQAVVENVDVGRLAVTAEKLGHVLALVLNGIKQTISASVRAGMSAKALESIFRSELALVTGVLRHGIYRGGSP